MQTYRSTPRFKSKRAARTWLAARELWQETEFSTRRVEMEKRTLHIQATVPYLIRILQEYERESKPQDFVKGAHD